MNKVNPSEFVSMAASVPGDKLALFERVGEPDGAASFWVRIERGRRIGSYRMDVHPKTMDFQFGPATKDGEMIRAFDFCEIVDGETEVAQ
jgi:hypothetical protein